MDKEKKLVFTAVIINLEGFTNENREEIVDIQDKTAADAFFLTETWHNVSTGSAKGSVVSLQGVLPDWNTQEVPCVCTYKSGYSACHGLAVMMKPDLNPAVERVCLVPASKTTVYPQEEDHRQLLSRFVIEDTTFDSILVHYKSGSADNVVKVTQILATIRALADSKADVNLVCGDFNMNPRTAEWEQCAKIFHDAGFKIISFTDVYLALPPEERYTRVNKDGSPGNFLDHVAVKCKDGFKCEVEMLMQDDFKISSDHLRMLKLLVWKGYDLVQDYNYDDSEWRTLFPNQCNDCGRGYRSQHRICKCSTRDVFEAYMRRRDAPKSFPCEACRRSFKSRGGLTAHSKTHNALIECPCCSNHVSRSVYLRHLRKRRQRRYICEIDSCGKQFLFPGSFHAHMDLHAGVRSVLCHLCDKKYVSRAGLYLHNLKTHIKRRNFSCKICGKGWPTSSALSSHMDTHGAYKYKCDECDSLFKSLKGKEVHVKSQHRQKEVMCEQCGLMLPSLYILNRHKQVHLDTKNFLCRFCEKEFKTAVTRNNHSRLVHEKKNLFKCIHCGKTFETGQNMRKHVSSHMRLKDEGVHDWELPIKAGNQRKSTRKDCEICGKVFGSSKYRRKHLKLHEKKKEDGYADWRIITTGPNTVSDKHFVSRLRSDHRKQLVLAGKTLQTN